MKNFRKSLLKISEETWIHMSRQNMVKISHGELDEMIVVLQIQKGCAGGFCQHFADRIQNFLNVVVP